MRTNLHGKLRTIGQTLSALGLLLAAGQARAATINVGTTCSLGDAIEAANSDATVGGCSAGSGADTIVLSANSTIVLTSADNTWEGGTGLPVVTSEITIDGNGSTIMRDASAPDFRILGVYGGDLTLNETTVSGGSALGGVFVGEGGGIYSYYGAVEVNDCVITGNYAEGRGSALGDRGSLLSINRSTIAGNTGISAVASVFGAITFDQSAVVLNEQHGVAVLAAPVYLDDSTVSSNGGGGLTGYWFYINRSTITGNGDAGLISYYTPPTITQSIISGNDGDPAWGREARWDESYGWAPVTEYNVFGFGGDAGLMGITPSATDIVPSGALGSILDPSLTANGGPTLTHLIRSTSPARDAAPLCSGVDQRGVLRPQGTSCDIGAVELVPDPCATATASSGCTVNGVANQSCAGGTGADVIVGTPGNDVILGRGGSDTVWAAGGDDIVCGGEGNDALHGGSGADVLAGGNGDDSLWGDYGGDSLNGGTGIDACTSDASDVSIVTCN